MRRPDTLLYGGHSSSHHEMMQQSSMSGEDASPQVLHLFACETVANNCKISLSL